MSCKMKADLSKDIRHEQRYSVHVKMSLFPRNLFRMGLSCHLSHVDSYINAHISRRPTLGKLRNMKCVCEICQ
jgi:hypothetical protein